MRRVWLAAAVWAAMFSLVLLAPQLGARVGQAQGGRGNLLRFCPGLGIPCVENFSRTSFGDHLASRGVAMFKDRIYFGTPDAHLIALDARNGTKVWEVEVADWKFGYYISAAPLVVKDKLLVGMSGDQLNMPGFLEARDLNDGKCRWSCSHRRGL